MRTLDTARLSAEEKVCYLLTIIKNADEKPFLAEYRPSEWFNVGDEVVCFVDFDGAIMQGFVSAKVTSGYRHYDGCVSVIAEERIHDNPDYYGGCGLWFGTSRPEVLHKWEYEYLRTHPEFLEVWLRAVSSDSLRSLSPEAFVAKMN